MLMSAGIFDKEVAFNVQEIEISQSASRILLGCLASGNKEVRSQRSLLAPPTNSLPLPPPVLRDSVTPSGAHAQVSIPHYEGRVFHIQ